MRIPSPPKKMKNKTLRLLSRRKHFIVVGMLFLRISRTMWVQKIKAASEHFIETEKKKREKAYQGNETVKIFLTVTRRRLKVYKAKTLVHPQITMVQEQRVWKSTSLICRTRAGSLISEWFVGKKIFIVHPGTRVFPQLVP